MAHVTAPLSPHPDRLLPADPVVRPVARRLYAAVRDVPIVSPHGHVDAQVLLDDQPFADPTSLLIQPDHYVTRLLHAGGVSLTELGVGEGPLPEDRARAAWRLLCANWHLLRGTPVRFWFDSELADIFGVTQRPSAANADALYDQIADSLQDPGHRPRALLQRFGIEFLATTDDPADDLAAHAALAADPAVTTRIAPTFRPDRYLEPAAPGWADAVKRLGDVAETDVGSYAGYLTALERRRRHFVAHGAVSADHGHADAVAAPVDPADAARIYTHALAGQVTAAEATAFRRHMMLEMARMSCEDGLVMTLHPGIHRTIIRRPGTGTARTPATTYRWRSSTPAPCSRCWSVTAPIRACTWCSSPWTPTWSAARSPRWPASTRRCTPELRGGSWTIRRRSASSRERSPRSPD
jgi:glucuronate isomerase